MIGEAFLRWPVDSEGYVLEHVGPTKRTPPTLLDDVEYDVIRPRGGPLRFYQPTDDEGLWRQFADACTDTASALAFVNEFGLLHGGAARTDPSRWSDQVDSVVNDAHFLRNISAWLDLEDRQTAMTIFNEQTNIRTAARIIQGPKGTLDLRPVPYNLANALVLQAGEAITGNHKFRRCRQCARYFRLGAGAHTTRREFCQDKCRVAWAWHKKRGAVQ
jgi:hypothetical protein